MGFAAQVLSHPANCLTQPASQRYMRALKVESWGRILANLRSSWVIGWFVPVPNRPRKVAGNLQVTTSKPCRRSFNEIPKRASKSLMLIRLADEDVVVPRLPSTRTMEGNSPSRRAAELEAVRRAPRPFAARCSCWAASGRS